MAGLIINRLRTAFLLGIACCLCVNITTAAEQPLPPVLPQVTPFANSSAPASSGAKVPPPAFDKISQMLQQQLSKNKNYQAGDLISSSDVAPLKSILIKAGWLPADWNQITREMLPPGDFLIQQSQSPAGQRFLRQLANTKNGYDRLDHLRRLPRGETDIRHLIQTPNGYELIQYMATTTAGQNLGRSLSHSPGGSNFNQPTRRIYTETDLIARLKTSYDRETMSSNAKSTKSQAVVPETSQQRSPNRPVETTPRPSPSPQPQFRNSDGL